jgi:hypothetical protein
LVGPIIEKNKKDSHSKPKIFKKSAKNIDDQHDRDHLKKLNKLQLYFNKNNKIQQSS